ncbi:MAG: hypothetical protein ACRD2A_08045 [Vicinamibacterales bacterium]
MSSRHLNRQVRLILAADLVDAMDTATHALEIPNRTELVRVAVREFLERNQKTITAYRQLRRRRS